MMCAVTTHHKATIAATLVLLKKARYSARLSGLECKPHTAFAPVPEPYIGSGRRGSSFTSYSTGVGLWPDLSGRSRRNSAITSAMTAQGIAKRKTSANESEKAFMTISCAAGGRFWSVSRLPLTFTPGAPAGSCSAIWWAMRLVSTAPNRAAPRLLPIDLKKVTEEVAVPSSSFLTAFCTARTVTGITQPSPSPKSTIQTPISARLVVAVMVLKSAYATITSDAPMIGKRRYLPILLMRRPVPAPSPHPHHTSGPGATLRPPTAMCGETDGEVRGGRRRGSPGGGGRGGWRDGWGHAAPPLERLGASVARSRGPWM
jgi:hypothetical protein